MSPSRGLQSPKRQAPHIVAPTFRSSRDDMLSSSSAPPELSILHASGANQVGSSYGAISDLKGTINNEESDDLELEPPFTRKTNSVRGSQRIPLLHQKLGYLQRAAGQIPAVALVTLFHLMVGVPFGVSYFPVGWRSSSPSAALSSTDDEVSEDHGGFVLDGAFPIPGKESLGIRMFLFSTIIGQIVMSFASNFNNCIGKMLVWKTVSVIGISS